MRAMNQSTDPVRSLLSHRTPPPPSLPHRSRANSQQESVGSGSSKYRLSPDPVPPFTASISSVNTWRPSYAHTGSVAARALINVRRSTEKGAPEPTPALSQAVRSPCRRVPLGPNSPPPREKLACGRYLVHSADSYEVLTSKTPCVAMYERARKR